MQIDPTRFPVSTLTLCIELVYSPLSPPTQYAGLRISANLKRLLNHLKTLIAVTGHLTKISYIAVLKLKVT